jgi:hypothetical protein
MFVKLSTNKNGHHGLLCILFGFSLKYSNKNSVPYLGKIKVNFCTCIYDKAVFIIVVCSVIVIFLWWLVSTRRRSISFGNLFLGVDLVKVYQGSNTQSCSAHPGVVDCQVIIWKAWRMKIRFRTPYANGNQLFNNLTPKNKFPNDIDLLLVLTSHQRKIPITLHTTIMNTALSYIHVQKFTLILPKSASFYLFQKVIIFISCILYGFGYSNTIFPPLIRPLPPKDAATSWLLSH